MSLAVNTSHFIFEPHSTRSYPCCPPARTLDHGAQKWPVASDGFGSRQAIHLAAQHDLSIRWPSSQTGQKESFLERKNCTALRLVRA